MLFRVLGPVDASDGERRVALSSGRQRIILAVLLAARGEAVSADALVDGVWGTHAPPSARKSLHSHISRLRRALATAAPDAAEILLTDTGGYRLDLDHHDVDADRFELLVAQARRDADIDPVTAVKGFDEALALWRGSAFGDLADLGPVRPEAVRLDQLRATAVADRVDVRLAMGDHDAMVADLEATVATDPLAERPHGQLMLAMYRSGRQAEALAVYRQLQKRLTDELGVDPTPHLRQLHERLLRQDPALEVEAPFVALAQAGDGLFGRDDDVAALTRLVASAGLVTLTGPGGVGKTRLAEEVAARSVTRFDDGVVACELAAVRDPASTPAALAGAIGVNPEGDRPLEESLLAALGSRRLLLVLDNCEHLVATVAGLVDRIRRRCPHVTVLATSRERLHLPGERVWEVAPLPVPEPDADATAVKATPGGALFQARAQAASPTFTLTDGNAPMVAELCRRLDGLPLAIELAAARIRALDPVDLADRLDHPFALLAAGPTTDAGRHRSLETVVAWSYDLLDERERRLFDRLSAFAGSFSLPAAEQVGAGDPIARTEVAGLLADLVDQSLVVVDRGDGRVRYRLLDTLRAFGAARLAATGEEARARAAHADYHVRLAEDLGPRVRGADERDALGRLDAVLDDLRIAHAWLVTASEVDGALRLAAALHDDLVFRPRSEVFTWAERALDLPGAADQPARAGALATAARGAMYRGDLGRARSQAEQALEAAGERGLVALQALYVLTTVALYEGRLDDVLELAGRRIELAEELGDDHHRALAGVSRALALQYRGDSVAAAAAAAEAREAADASGNHTARAWALYSLGEALLDRDPEGAAGRLEDAIDAAREVRGDLIEGVAAVSLASLRGRIGDTRRALALFRWTVTHWRRLGHDTHQLTTLRNLVELLARAGADEPAALLHGAVTAGATPSFGAEADRLAAAWAEVEGRLGGTSAEAAAARGRALAPDETLDTMIATLDRLLDPATPNGLPGRRG